MRGFIVPLAFLMAAAPSYARDLPLAHLSPPPGASTVCPDTQFHLTFDSAPALGAGKIEIHDADSQAVIDSIDVATPTLSHTVGGLTNVVYYPVLITGKEAVITFSKPLAYGKHYYLTINPGTFKENDEASGGIDKPDTWRFTTKAAAPEAGKTKLTVAADNSGDFATLQGALDFIPAGNTTPTTLLMKKGTYHEIIHFTNKNAITILGEDRKGTILEYPNNNNFNRDTSGGFYRRGMLLAQRCNDVVLANMTFHNTTPRGGSQAEAIILNGTPTSRAIVTNVDLISYQDTLQINGQGYVSNCYIEGDVDFMWGNGPVFFENCICTTTRSGAYYTQIRNRATNHGYVYYHCTFNGAEGIENNFLARINPGMFQASEVVLIDCVLTKAVGDIAWKLDGNATEVPPGLHFWEYNSHDPDGKPVDTSKRLNVSKQLKQPDDAETIKNYSNPTWVLGNDWTPKIPADVAAATQPAR